MDAVNNEIEVTQKADSLAKLDNGRGKFVSVSGEEISKAAAKYKLDISDDERKNGAIFFASLNNPTESELDHVDVLSRSLGISKYEADKIVMKDAGIVRKGTDNTFYLFGFMENDRQANEVESQHQETIQILETKYPQYKFKSA